MHSFTFDGTKSAVYGLMVSGSGTFNAPERDVTKIPVPGRNGTLTIDNGRFENITVTYPGVMVFHTRASFASQVLAVNAWLSSKPGYRRLEDDYHPEYFRLARFINGAEWTTEAINSAGRAKLQFDCDPRRFLKSGETAVTKTANGYITNPTLFDALPLITVYGSGAGEIRVAGTTITISEIGDSVTLDCESWRAYHENQGGTIEARDDTITGTFPSLHAGRNYVRLSGGVTSVDIIPRWWTV